ncbi:MAG: HEAT repeat domain-containing protein [Capsulimonadales bacterium]|nr:HEAT repeat domain-containing protein [Capsulimonadales bacterium]
MAVEPDLERYLANDETVREFLINGFCVLKADLPADFHRGIYDRTRAILTEEGNPGNNILPRLPEVNRVYEHPAIRGALTGLLGPNYVMHVHRHMHSNTPRGNGGGWHKDSYWGYGKIRDHHPRWLMAIYYPQDTPVELGPTGTVPGSQYFETRVPTLPLAADAPPDPEGIGLPGVGEAGTVLLIHFDLWHRAYPNHSDQERYMFKFQFTRMDEPSGPTWNRTSEEIPLGELADHPRAPIWRQMWRWLSGDPTWETTGDAGRLADALRDASEERRLSAAYVLGGLGDAGRDALNAGLRDDREEVRRAACYGLTTTGAASLPDLVAALSADNDRTRGYAVYALGDRGGRAADAVPALTALVDDPSEFVRRHLADALGQVRHDAGSSVPVLIRLLRDTDGQTRFNAAYGLAKFGEAAAPAVPALAAALDDENRYVRGHAAIALERIGTPGALRTLLQHLQAMRWCPITTPKSTF